MRIEISNDNVDWRERHVHLIVQRIKIKNQLVDWEVKQMTGWVSGAGKA